MQRLGGLRIEGFGGLIGLTLRCKYIYSNWNLCVDQISKKTSMFRAVGWANQNTVGIIDEEVFYTGHLCSFGVLPGFVSPGDVFLSTPGLLVR